MASKEAPVKKSKKVESLSDLPVDSTKLATRALVQPDYLPSLGLPYGDLVPEGKVFISAITTKEQKIFTGAASSGQDKLSLLFSRTCDLGPLDPNDLVIEDRFYLLLNLRALTYGNDYGFPYMCSNCSKQQRYAFKVPGDLKLTKAPDGDTPNEFGEMVPQWEEPFYADLKVAKKRVGLRLLRAKDEGEINKLVKRKREQAVVEAGDPAYTMTMSRHIVSVEDQNVSQMAALQFFESLVGMDGNIIQQAIDDNSFGYDSEIEIRCDSCGYESKIILPVTEEFFRPKLR